MSRPERVRPLFGLQTVQASGAAMSFGQHLRTLRAEAGPSRAELARRASVPVSTLRHWESDQGFPGLAFLRLAEALGVPAERLAEGVDELAGDDRESTP
jgi:transcriptional regulator with XRE-family HTH domain